MSKPNAVEKPKRKVDQATQTVAAILLEFGRQAFHIADRSETTLQSMCDSWISHLLEGESSPNQADLSENWLDWPGVRDFVAAERGREKKYVVENINEYQDLALTLLSDFSDSVQVEQESDGEFRDKLEGLKENAKLKSGDELKAEVFSTVSTLNDFLEAKKDRHSNQLEGLAAQVMSLQSELAQARESAERDGLTKLYNRAAFDSHVVHSISRLENENVGQCLLMADIDHFKKLNDNYGHQLGDEVIQAVSDCMAKVFSDEDHFVARYGGEEFAIVCEHPIEMAYTFGDLLLKSIRALRFNKDGEEISVTISIGISSLESGEDGKSWIERADKALYASKELGRNRVTLASI